MYEMGREAEKRNPSSPIWIVCMVLNPEALDDVQEKAPPPTRDDFMTAEGKHDRAAFVKALSAWQQEQAVVAEQTGVRVTPFHYAAARFMSARKLEAQMISAHGSFPRGVPYDEQPAWKWQLWSRYWDGEDDERKRMERY